jgi:hypothetical protein
MHCSGTVQRRSRTKSPRCRLSGLGKHSRTLAHASLDYRDVQPPSSSALLMISAGVDGSKPPPLGTPSHPSLTRATSACSRSNGGRSFVSIHTSASSPRIRTPSTVTNRPAMSPEAAASGVGSTVWALVPPTFPRPPVSLIASLGGHSRTLAHASREPGSSLGHLEWREREERQTGWTSQASRSVTSLGSGKWPPRSSMTTLVRGTLRASHSPCWGGTSTSVRP